MVRVREFVLEGRIPLPRKSRSGTGTAAQHSDTLSVLSDSSGGGSRSTRKRKRNKKRMDNAAPARRQARAKATYKHFTILPNFEFIRGASHKQKEAPEDPCITLMHEMDPLPLDGADDGEDGPFDPRCWSFVRASHPSQERHLKRFDRPAKPLAPEHRTAHRRALERVEELMTLPAKLPWPSKEDLLDVRFAELKYPGAHYWEQDMETRGQACVVAHEEAELLWLHLLCGIRMPTRPVKTGGRGKLTRKQVELPNGQGFRAAVTGDFDPRTGLLRPTATLAAVAPPPTPPDPRSPPPLRLPTTTAYRDLSTPYDPGSPVPTSHTPADAESQPRSPRSPPPSQARAPDEYESMLREYIRT